MDVVVKNENPFVVYKENSSLIFEGSMRRIIKESLEIIINEALEIYNNMGTLILDFSKLYSMDSLSAQTINLILMKLEKDKKINLKIKDNSTWQEKYAIMFKEIYTNMEITVC